MCMQEGGIDVRGEEGMGRGEGRKGGEVGTERRKERRESKKRDDREGKDKRGGEMEAREEYEVGKKQKIVRGIWIVRV